MKEEIEKQIDDILTFMTLAIPVRSWMKLSAFSECEPMTKGFIRAIDGTDLEDRVFLDPKFVAPRNLILPFNLSSASNVIEDGYKDRKFHIGLQRTTRVSPASIRGRVRRFFPINVQHFAGGITTEGRYEETSYFAGWNGRRWVHNRSTDSRLVEDPQSIKEVELCVEMGASIIVNRFYEWRVVLGYENAPTISFTTDPLGAQEAFRLRDIPEGRERRAALKHWVREHWRQTRAEPVRVRAHLRGAERFTWNGLRCTIYPSPLDSIRAKGVPIPDDVALSVRDAAHGRRLPVIGDQFLTALDKA